MSNYFDSAPMRTFNAEQKATGERWILQQNAYGGFYVYDQVIGFPATEHGFGRDWADEVLAEVRRVMGELDEETIKAWYRRLRPTMAEYVI